MPLANVFVDGETDYPETARSRPTQGGARRLADQLVSQDQASSSVSKYLASLA